MQLRTTRTRLASAVTAVLAVTALGAGALATAPAVFAAPAQAAAETSTLPVFPTGAQVLATGPSGFLTHDRFVSGGSTSALLWTPYDGGTPTPVAVPDGGGWASAGGDVLVVGDAPSARDMRAVTLRNMADPAAPSVTIDLSSLNASYVTVLGPTSVLAQVQKGDGEAELLVVTRNGAALETEPVTGLPAYAQHFWSDAPIVNGQVLVGHMASKSDPVAGGRSVIDIASGSVVLTYGADEGGIDFSHLLFSESYVGWYEREGTAITLTTVSRGQDPKRTTKILSAAETDLTALAGDWLILGNPSAGVRAYSLSSGDSRPVTNGSGTTGLAAEGEGTSVVSGERPDGTRGLFRLGNAENGDLAVTKIADMELGVPLAVVQSHVPTTVNLDKSGGKVALGWTLSRPDATMDVTLTHIATGKVFRQQLGPVTDGTSRFSFDWAGEVFGPNAPHTDDAPNGAYTVAMQATQVDAIGETIRDTRRMELSRTPNPHDYTNNGSTDVLARDTSGVLWRDDLRDRPVNGQVNVAGRTRIGTGWGVYKQIEAVGNAGGAATGDLIAVDGSGVQWLYLGKGDGTFAPRVQVGTGWQIYNKITGGSDLDGDGRADLVGTDGAGVLWFYKGTGNYAKPYAPRVRIGGGWQIYNHITAVGNIAGTAAGDLVARDTYGVLWLYQGNGAGGFAPRVRIGGGWGVFSQLVGAGDLDNDGRPDLIAYGSGGTYVYRSTGSATAPFARMTTNLYAGEGTKFNNVS
ncbi:VCBS repeat-containing protein [Streptomyces sp. NK15101]|uniref:FG-GAP repeat domain-containing protein n=1 Tax=Streptomyces sp. NK15101 TaxID=2873261 RepID=UPI001CECF499|nr:VCBS repeat-containing protein [Streptomyces sp. NK15101]